MHFQFLLAFVFALLHVRSLQIRVLFGLLAAAYFCFYAGYIATGDEEIRFVLPALAAGFPVFGIWLTSGRMTRTQLAAGLLFSFVCAALILPVCRNNYQPLVNIEALVILIRVVIPVCAFFLARYAGGTGTGLKFAALAAAFSSGLWFIPALGLAVITAVDIIKVIAVRRDTPAS